jgi:hypothetical protein
LGKSPDQLIQQELAGLSNVPAAGFVARGRGVLRGVAQPVNEVLAIAIAVAAVGAEVHLVRIVAGA